MPIADHHHTVQWRSKKGVGRGGPRPGYNQKGVVKIRVIRGHQASQDFWGGKLQSALQRPITQYYTIDTAEQEYDRLKMLRRSFIGAFDL